jgi:BlaI family transcriptional regulator, penicillinase repressor
MPDSFPTLGDHEVQVLRLVWQHQPCTERQISDLIQKDRGVARTTVLKTLQRLEAKGLLSRAPNETPIRYWAAVEEKHLMPTLIGRFVERVLGGSASPLVAYLADSQKLPDQDIEALRTLVTKMKQPKAPQ